SNYMVNSLARSLRLNDTRIIGIVVPDISNGFFSRIIKGAQDVCFERDYMLMVCNSDENANYEEKALRTLMENQVSGLIVASVGSCREFFETHPVKNVPVVYIDNVPKGAKDYDLVSIDNRQAAAELTRAVLARGYREIGMITGPLAQSSGSMRYEGFKNALNEAGIDVVADWVKEGEFSLESGYTNMLSILSLKKRPRAMLFANNKLAYGAVRAIHEIGLRIPEDMAVVSFDAYDRTGLVKPRIVSLNQPAEEIGKCAGEMIVDKLTGNITESGRCVFLDPYFTDGNSW
ncbi:MAG: LacI family DNA-binding transcriptional regulator, partial [Clostridia bacterium]|nr:LacI family DNA-binding transcriptional regulator [Clostridia bacterium]